MSWIIEGPWPILLTVLLVEAFLLVSFIRSGNLKLFWWIGGTAVLGIVLLVAERFIVTDNERITTTLDGIAAAAQANDLNGILVFVAPEAHDVRRLAETSLHQVTITEAGIGGDLEIEIHDETDPPTAQANFTGHFRGHPRRDPVGHDVFIGQFKTALVKQGDQWLVTSVDHNATRVHK
jgi:hypothetical protein